MGSSCPPGSRERALVFGNGLSEATVQASKTIHGANPVAAPPDPARPASLPLPLPLSRRVGAMRALSTGLGLLTVVLTACWPEPDYLHEPPAMGPVWAVDGDRFYVGVEDAVVLWNDRVPKRVVWQGTGPVTALWGRDDKLEAFIRNGTLMLRRGDGGWKKANLTVEVDALWGVDDDLYIATSSAIDAGFESQASRIQRIQDGDWTVEQELPTGTHVIAIRGDKDRGLWATGYTWLVNEDNALEFAAVLRRRGQSGWETMDSTYLYPHSSSEVTMPTGLWVDLQGKAHVIHDEPGIFVHDGVQSWMEPIPIPEAYDIGHVSMSPEGTVFASAQSWKWETEPTLLLIDDGSGWKIIEMQPKLRPQGLSAYDGGAILTACSADQNHPCFVGHVIRVQRDGTLDVIERLWLGEDYVP